MSFIYPTVDWEKACVKERSSGTALETVCRSKPASIASNPR